MMLEHNEQADSATELSPPPSTSLKQDVSNENQRKHFREKNANQTPLRNRYSIAGRTPLSPGYGAVVSALSKLNRLDDFVLEPLAKGFFSDVSKVWHRTSGEVMVLKMNKQYDNRANVIHEVELLNRLEHKNIVRFMGVCVHNGQLHALTEYVNGGDLQHLLLDENVSITWDVRISLSRDVANGMNYVHAAGYIHRDLTAMNVLVRKEGRRWQGVVADFGLATTIPRNNEVRSMAGSPYWMAPECLRYEFYNEKADVFSFGIILCQTIARIQAHPNWLPRLGNFALDEVGFKRLSSDCPDSFLQLAFTCCQMEHEKRPSFEQISGMIHKVLEKMREDRANQNLERFRNQNELSGKQRSHTSISHLDVPPGQVNPKNFPLARSNSARLSKHAERPQVLTKNSSNPFDTPQLKGGHTKIVSSPCGFELDIPPKLSAMFKQLDLDEQYFEFKMKNRRKSLSLPTSPILRKKSTDEDIFDDCEGPKEVKALFESENVELTHRLLSWQERKHSVKHDGSGDWEIHTACSPTVTLVNSVNRHDSGVCSLFDEEATPSNSSHGSVDDAFIGATSKRNSTGE
ncbi:dual specificity testis-specific protein kinase 2-like [Anneissia japonica]|uniref:dual specificity testis-specific protein kinase 2-like n=1 Tax=Anneissia japonica TaxID=1529436 RepID=UPI001425A8AF|nr:dual specificity testis-specific protein kinase 2-like [Anneissia japonica]